ncbi:MAG: VanZ family protein [Syntrophomonadaceae bacterium]|nr:VanZ family protein [Syntrophomonadaceae bacterium]
MRTNVFFRFLVVLFWLLLIMNFSGQGLEQQDLSPYLEKMKWLEKGILELSRIQFYYHGELQDSYADPLGFAHFMIRKTAHFVLYGFLGLSLFWALRGIGLHRLSSFFITGMVVFIVAVIDESRQYFIPGRTGCFQDVILDVSGCAVFILGVLLFKFVLKYL